MILYRTRALTMVAESRTRAAAPAMAYFNIAILRGVLGDAEKERKAAAVAAMHCSSRVL